MSEDDHLNPYEGDDSLLFAEEEFEEEKTEIFTKPWYVLIVDDDDDVHTLTRMVFRDVDFEDRSIEFLSAYSGSEGISILERHPEVAVVLLDVVMETPDAGFQTVKEIRERLDNPMVRIVLRTGQPGIAPEESVILDYDVNDYVAKTEPFSRLLTSVITGLRSFRDLQIRRQFNLAAALEEHMFTRKFPQFTGYEIVARNQSALETGGDFYEIQSVSDHEVVMVVGDVSGKGLPASLYVSATLSMIRTQLECYKSVEREDMLRPASILKMVNRLLLKTLQRGKFVTMFIGVLDVRSHQFCYASAGHCAAYMVVPGQEPKALQAGGMVCGLCGAPFDKMVKESCVSVPMGGYVVVNTDGLTEATNRSGEMYGDERYKNQVGKLQLDLSAREAMSLIWDDVMEHLNHGDLSDDCTLACIKRRS